MTEIGGHHADDRVGIHVGPNPPPDHIGVGAELPAPECIADDDAVEEAWRPVLLSVCAPERGLHTEQLEVVRAGGEELDALDMVGATKGAADRPDGADRVEDARFLDVLHFRYGHAGVACAGARQIIEDADDAVGLLDGQRPQKDCPHYGEDREIGADAEHQGQERYDDESRRSRQGAKGVAQIQEQLFHEGVGKVSPDSTPSPDISLHPPDH